ncbi:MAG TPA: preprotein translocase subunit SecA [Candidatus Humimicrobiaceae bacterium]|nr:preprotein translocase subunit SecA [Candidatus Humimicrobiaceae bacterium]
MSIIAKIFGDANEKYLKQLQPVVDKIDQLESEFEAFSNEQLKAKTQELKEKLRAGEFLDDILPEAFAQVREAAKRNLDQRHFDCQLIGGIVLHQGKIAEMKTGEGKTLAATLPLYLNALEGKGCHLVTVNDYLAKRDTVWMGQIYHALGMSTGCIVHDTAYLYDPTYINEQKTAGGEQLDEKRDAMGAFKVVEDYLKPCSRKEAYEADITYGTNNEFGFDYLRDNMVYEVSQQVQRGFNFVIVDEVDSILIDEARTPLIISAPDMESSKWYQEFARIIPGLDPKTDYQVDEKLRTVTLAEGGINKIEKILGMGNIYEEKGIKYVHHLEQALRAEVLFKKDRDYVIKSAPDGGGEIIIVDEFTGRLMPGRRWSGGLHQAVEAKEGVRVQPESLTLASITFQNYFRMYKKLAGMTGTAATSAEEFDKVYKLEVIIVPTNRPMIRQYLPDRIYKTKEGKFKALVREVKEHHQKGQPILIGTGGFTVGQYTMGAIEKNRIIKTLLEREGITCQVLDATNHEREGEIIAQAGKAGQVTVATNMAGRGVDIILGGNPQDPEEAEKVKEAGGLHVIGSERHEARRIDNQLQGRSGRQGDPGSSQFFISLEDDLMRIFATERIQSLMTILKIPEDQPIEAKMISGAIESAQSKIEGFNFDMRKHLLDYDDVLNKHREVIYKKRKRLLQTEDWRLQIEAWVKSDEAKKALVQKEKELGENFNQIAKFVALRTIDMFWMNHLEEMEALRDSVRLRAYGQRDPLVEYKSEGHKMFQRLIANMETNIVNMILRASLQPQAQQAIHASQRQAAPVSVNQRSKNKPGRNDPCPCGSGKKYKKCCYPKYG